MAKGKKTLYELSSEIYNEAEKIIVNGYPSKKKCLKAFLSLKIVKSLGCHFAGIALLGRGIGMRVDKILKNIIISIIFIFPIFLLYDMKNIIASFIAVIIFGLLTYAFSLPSKYIYDGIENKDILHITKQIEHKIPISQLDGFKDNIDIFKEKVIIRIKSAKIFFWIAWGVFLYFGRMLIESFNSVEPSHNIPHDVLLMLLFILVLVVFYSKITIDGYEEMSNIIFKTIKFSYNEVDQNSN